MSDFGDAEPEDAWHPDDELDEQLANLRRRVALLLAVQDRIRERLRQLAEDMEFVQERVLRGR